MPGSESIHLSAWRMLLPAALVLALAGCSKDAPTAPQDSVSTPNNAPTIASLAAIPAQVQVGRNADVVADAIDPDGDPITYEWRAELGAIFGEGSRVVYASGGCCVGVDTIHLTVKDGRGGTVAATTQIEVLP